MICSLKISHRTVPLIIALNSSSLKKQTAEQKIPTSEQI
ncbi:hypothetical protein NI35_3723 [Salmonella enterica subsp. enterica serovar Cerro]|nr:hypothetical protein STM14_5407 [Salmonella enterica subsp. enterica serovar Typhimurium str. 14028S]AIE08484.1 hypothetical protein DC51_4628 [Salmonella enterica subsp. enterica serovar Typhimurium]APT80333.1 hypothetical protein GW13_PRO3461 [Salmonella enterica subsp. enterica serovar Cerro]EDX51302.1 hypothetical protein SNSL317_A2083 [Salmonella enterica subsp. enterica serovar Newport str. SL317]EDY24112.1 hypothetical protein SeSPA_A0398 [Salmonella enterica subsp. enterica serovar S